MKTKSNLTIKRLTDRNLIMIYRNCMFLIENCYKRRTDEYCTIANTIKDYYNQFVHKGLSYTHLHVNMVEDFIRILSREIANRYCKLIK